MFQQLSRGAAFLSVPRFAVLAVGIAIGLSLVVGASLVAAQRGEPGDSPTAQSYQGCVNTYTGVLRVIDDGEQCQDHELPIQLGGGTDTELLDRIAQLESTVATLQQANTAQQTTIDTLNQKVTDQQGEIDALEQENTTQQTTIDTLVSDNTALQAQVPDCLSTEGSEVYFTGCNVNVRSGAGATDADVNGLGNLIIGYNEEDLFDERTGSHNLVVGATHSYSSYGGLVVGSNNTISGPYSSVSGGYDNTASGSYSSVSGGYDNTASGGWSSVSGGEENTAGGSYSSVSGGYDNTASGSYSSVSGGDNNTAGGLFSSVSGGAGNTASGYLSSISGGEINTASGYLSSVSGGSERSAPNDYDWRGGEYFSEE